MLTYPKYAVLLSPCLLQKLSNHLQFHSFYYYNEIVYLFRMSLSPLITSNALNASNASNTSNAPNAFGAASPLAPLYLCGWAFS